MTLPLAAQPVPQLEASQVDQQIEQRQPLILDVRSPQEIQQLGTLPGAINIPLDELPQRWEELPRDRVILTT